MNPRPHPNIVTFVSFSHGLSLTGTSDTGGLSQRHFRSCRTMVQDDNQNSVLRNLHVGASNRHDTRNLLSAGESAAYD